MEFVSPWAFFFDYFWIGLVFHICMFYVLKVFFGYGLFSFWGGDLKR